MGLRRSIIGMDHLSKAGLPGRSKQRADVYSLQWLSCDPKIVDFRLVQLSEWVVGDDLTLERIMDLAGPLTPQAMARIEEALNTPIGELPAKV